MILSRKSSSFMGRWKGINRIKLVGMNSGSNFNNTSGRNRHLKEDCQLDFDRFLRYKNIKKLKMKYTKIIRKHQKKIIIQITEK